MVAGKSFVQSVVQTSRIERMPPIPHKRLENFIRHNTLMFIEKVVVRKLSRTKNGTVWSFLVPDMVEDLVCHMFDMSLSCNVIDYQCGETLYDSKIQKYFWSDVITVVDSQDGKTNITHGLIDAMGERYACDFNHPDTNIDTDLIEAIVGKID